MTATLNLPLLIAAGASAIAALLHLAIIVGGAHWYRVFGAGRRMVSAAEQGRVYPTVVTLAIAFVLAIWAAYALDGAGMNIGLPWVRPALCAITAVYLLRGLVIVPLLVFAPRRATPFWCWSSLVCLAYGSVHALGLAQRWNDL